MKIKDLSGILYNNHGCPLQTTTLWRFGEDGGIDEYVCGVHEYIIKNYPDKEVKKIQADVDANGDIGIVIQTN
jgi:hypothetical protein